MRGNLSNNFHRVSNQAAHNLNSNPKNEDHQTSSNKVPQYEDISDWKGRSASNNNNHNDQNASKGFKQPLARKGLLPLNSSFIMNKNSGENVPPVPTNDSVALAAMLSVPPPNVGNGGPEDAPVVSSVGKKNEMAIKADAQTAWSLLHEYWTFVQENPYDFNGWSYLLTHVESMKHIEAARSAFEGFLPLYPYCFAYWKKLSDLELKFSMLPRCLGVLIYGTKSVPLCHEIWINLFTNFKNYAKQENVSVDIIRLLYKSGLERIGLAWHSSPFWEECIKFEIEQKDLLKVMTIYKWLISIPIKVFNKHWDQLVAMIRDNHPQCILSLDVFDHYYRMCCDQLKIKYVKPQQYNSEKPPKIDDQILMLIKEKILAGLIKIHEENTKQVDKRWKFEEKIKRPYFHVKPIERRQLKAWNDYLDFEIKQGDPVRTLILFERCLVSCAQYEEMWCRYAAFLELHVQRVAGGRYKDVVYRPGCFSTDKSVPETTKPGKNSVSDTDALLQKGVWFDFYYDITEDIKAEGSAFIEQLCDGVEVGSRVLSCPTLTPSWILRDVTNEDVRQVYRRASWIHCPSKPLILMQWAEFEESQGDIQTARDLLNTVLSKHALSLPARMQLIDLERRSGMLNRVEELYSQAFTSYKDPKEKSFIAIRFARFLFKFKDDFDTSLALIRKALKKDKGNVFLYNQVFNICYEKRPVDCDGVMAAVMLALASKELSLDQKKQFCLQKSQFLRDHGTILQIKDAQLELSEIQEKLDAIKDEEEKVEKELKKQEELKMKEIELLAKELIDKEAKRTEELKRENALELGELTRASDEDANYSQPKRMSSSMKRFGDEDASKTDRRKKRHRKRSPSPRNGHSKRPHNRRARRTLRNDDRSDRRKSRGSIDNREISRSDRSELLPPPQPDGILTRSEFGNDNSGNVGNLHMPEKMNEPPLMRGPPQISRNPFMKMDPTKFNGGQLNMMRPPAAAMYDADLQQRSNQQRPLGDADMQRPYPQRPMGDMHRPLQMGDDDRPRLFPQRSIMGDGAVQMPPMSGDSDRGQSFPQRSIGVDDMQRRLPPQRSAMGDGDQQRPPPQMSMGDGDLQRPPRQMSMGDGDLQRPPRQMSMGDGDLQRPSRQMSMGDGDLQRPRQMSMGDGDLQRPRQMSMGDCELQRPPRQMSMGDGDLQRPLQMSMGDGDAPRPSSHMAMGDSDMHRLLPQRATGEGDFQRLLSQKATGEGDFHRLLPQRVSGEGDFQRLLPQRTNGEGDFQRLLPQRASGDADMHRLLPQRATDEGDFQRLHPQRTIGERDLQRILPQIAMDKGDLQRLLPPQRPMNDAEIQPRHQQLPVMGDAGMQTPPMQRPVAHGDNMQRPPQQNQTPAMQRPVAHGDNMQRPSQQRPISEPPANPNHGILGEFPGKRNVPAGNQAIPALLSLTTAPPSDKGADSPSAAGIRLKGPLPMITAPNQGPLRPMNPMQNQEQLRPMNPLQNQGPRRQMIEGKIRPNSLVRPQQGQLGSINPVQSQGQLRPMNPIQSQMQQRPMNPLQSQGQQRPMNQTQGSRNLNSALLMAQQRPTNPVAKPDATGPFNPAMNRPPFQPNIVSVPRNLNVTPPGGPILNVPDWLIAEGGEFKLSQGPKGDCVLKYWPRFMNEMGHDTLLAALRKSIKWLNQKVNVQGNWTDVPMMMSWLGPCEYKKDGISLNANPNWPPEIVDLLHTLSRVCEMETQFNSCLLRLFRNGYDHQVWDSEEHPAMNNNPKIAVVSVGAVRTVEMRHKNGPEYVRFPLLPGSLLFMEGATQADWIHQITKDPKVGAERISLSFRTMLMINGLTV